MGSPELPNDPGEDDLRTNHIVHHPVAMSDDSDNDAGDDGYDGYQPLSMDENQEYGSIALQDEEDDDIVVQGFHRTQQRIPVQEEEQEDEYLSAEVTHGDPNLPPVESVDSEVEREVWSQPRPEELEIELDSNKTEQILSAMANFSLPNMAVPPWADGVPEERWKEELLQRIRQRKPTSNDGEMDIDKETK